MARAFKLVVGAALAVAITLPARAAHAEEEGESAAMASNRGLRIGLGPTILMPIRDNGPLGGGLTLDARYGVRIGPAVFAPGGRLNGYLISSRSIGTAIPTLRVTVPVGPLAPFVVGGLGLGGVTNPNESGLASLLGGGLMFHFGRVLGIGAEATYQVIAGTEFKSLAIGPAISLGG